MSAPIKISHAERLISALGGFCGIFVILSLHWFYALPNSHLIVASMGASAVLLFAVPHGPMSQPWHLAGGHFFSAIVGVTCGLLIQDVYVAAACAVGLSILIMHYLRCIHPPGGATALAFVVGGEPVLSLGYQYVLMPVMVDVLLILLVAIVFNWWFGWRRYPLALSAQDSTRRDSETGAEAANNRLEHDDLMYALSEIDSFVDVSEEDLMKIYELATIKAYSRVMPLEEIRLGGYYSNGRYGDEWSVRQIVDEPEPSDSGDDAGNRQVVYKVVAGQGRRTSGVCDRNDFALWARYEVERDEENWKRVK